MRNNARYLIKFYNKKEYNFSSSKNYKVVNNGK